MISIQWSQTHIPVHESSPTFPQNFALEKVRMATHPHQQPQIWHFWCHLPWELQVLAEGSLFPLCVPVEECGEESAGVNYLLFELLS